MKYEDALKAYERKDYKGALNLLRHLAQQNDVRAQHKLSMMYEEGEGVPKYPAEAAKWCRKSAEQGYDFAQLSLALKYAEGRCVPQDYTEAIKWARKSAEQGNAMAQGLLGVMYEEGKGVPIDYVEAYKWLSLADLYVKNIKYHITGIPRLTKLASKMTQEQIAEATAIAEGSTLSLILQLKSPYTTKRLSAVDSLGRLGDVRAIKPLFDLLQDRNTSATVRKATAEALEKLFARLGDLAVEPLLIVMKDSDTTRLLTVMKDRGMTRLLTVMKDRGMTPPLGDLIEIVGRSLGKGHIASEAICKLGKRAVDPLINSLMGDNHSIHKEAADALVTLGEMAVEPLINVLKDSYIKIRQTATEDLATILLRQGDISVIESLLTAVKDNHNHIDIRKSAYESLDRLGINNALTDIDYGCIRAIEVLGKLGNSRAIEPLINVLTDMDGGRIKATEILVIYGDMRALELLINMLNIVESGFRSAAAKSLGLLGDQRAVDPLINALMNDKINVRRSAAEALGKLGDFRAINPLTNALEDTDEYVRQAAKEALAKLPCP